MGTTITGGFPSPAPNILINPFMEIDQANEGASVSLTNNTFAYGVDGWQSGYSATSAVVTSQRVADGPLTYPNSLKLTVSTGGTVSSTSFLAVRQPIEGDNITELAMGNASAQTMSLTFWAKSSIGSYVMSGAIQNFAQNRSYCFNATIPSSATWTQFKVIIPGDTGGTWVNAGAAGGMYLTLVAAAGSSFQGTANTWTGSSILSTSSNTNTILSTSGATFQVSGVKLECTASPTPYGRRGMANELARCQRYYEKSYDLGTAVASVTANGAADFLAAVGFGSKAGTTVFYKVSKRGDPSVTTYSATTGSSGKTSDQVNSVDVVTSVELTTANSFSYYAVPSTGSNAHFQTQWTSDSRL